MGKKKLRAKYTSKGERRSVAAKNLVKETSFLDQELNKWRAFVAGKNVFFRVPNTGADAKKAPWIRVNGKVLFGDYRKYRGHYNMWRGGEDKEKKSNGS